MLVRCINCGFSCQKYGKTKAGSQRWYCKQCNITFTQTIDNTTKCFHRFLNWLFSKETQQDMPGQGRTFRRQIADFWQIWPMPPKIETSRDVVFVDGIYLAKKACILICYDGEYVLGWYLCRSEQSRSWQALMQRITTPIVVVSDGGPGLRKALKKVWRTAKLQRCIVHAVWQVHRYTTRRPKTLAGIMLKDLASDLYNVKTQEDAKIWIQRLFNWRLTFKEFLSEMTRDSNDNLRATHERLLKAYNSLVVLINTETMFRYLDETLVLDKECPRTNNPIEGGVNAQLRRLLRYHRGMSVEKRIKAVFWWCYLHSPRPLSAKEILKVMPTDASISKIYSSMNERAQLQGIIPTWGDAISWGDLHNYDKLSFNDWD